MRVVLPLCVFLILSAFLAAGLRLDPRHVPSPLIGKPAPHFELTQLHEPNQTFTPEDLLGRIWLLNVWASWCVSCRVEHELLAALSRAGVVPIYGLAYKDRRENSLAFLQSFGDPYVLSLEDPDGRVGIDYGVYGVPETYLIDKAGVIRFKQVGPITVDVVKETIVPMVARLSR
jgi:cytochrome c biogenesis protein CcmG/thiol:disulfide interchange protein DsbE